MGINKLNQVTYPDFQNMQVIDPEKFDQNNADLVTKLDETITVINKITDNIADGDSGADQISITPVAPFGENKLMMFLKSLVNKLITTGTDLVQGSAVGNVAGGKLFDQLSAIVTRLTSVENVASVNGADISTLNNAMSTHTHNTLYYTKTELDPYLQTGDTVIKKEVFTIVNPNLGNGTFTYQDKDGGIGLGDITAQGYQVFYLLQGTYPVGENKIEAIINDTLHRDTASGGLIEISDWQVGLTTPEGAGAEISFTYFERIGLTGEHGLLHEYGGTDEIKGLIKVSATEPTHRYDNALWLDIS